jgi:hypothetical protein
LSTKLKRLVGMLVAGAALSVATLAVLPEMAEAQSMDGASIEAEQNTNGNVGAASVADVAGAAAATPQRAPEESAALLVVNPGDSLWAIAQERLGPEATPQQVAQETGRIYELNREQIGDDPNLILPGQELLVAQGPEPAADVSSTTEGAATTTTTVAQEPATAERPTVVAQETPEPVEDNSAAGSSSKANAAERSYPEPEYTDRLVPDLFTVLLSLGVFLGTLAVATLAVSRLLRKRRLLRKHPVAPHESSVHHERRHYPKREAEEEEEPAAAAAAEAGTSVADEEEHRP